MLIGCYAEERVVLQTGGISVQQVEQCINRRVVPQLLAAYPCGPLPAIVTTAYLFPYGNAVCLDRPLPEIPGLLQQQCSSSIAACLLRASCPFLARWPLFAPA